MDKKIGPIHKRRTNRLCQNALEQALPSKATINLGINLKWEGWKFGSVETVVLSR